MDAVASAEQFQEEAAKTEKNNGKPRSRRSGVGAKRDTIYKGTVRTHDSAWVLHVP